MKILIDHLVTKTKGTILARSNHEQMPNMRLIRLFAQEKLKAISQFGAISHLIDLNI